MAAMVACVEEVWKILDLVVPKCQGRRIRRQFFRAWPDERSAFACLFAARKRVRARQKAVTASLNSRDLMYRLGPAPKSGTWPIRPMSVENRRQKPGCTFVYHLVAR